MNLTRTDNELAHQLIVTSPEGDETYDKGDLRALLYDPKLADRARYARIFRLAIDMTDSRERAASFALEMANGERRRPGLWDIKAVMEVLESTNSNIARLPDNPRRNRLMELSMYHAGLVYREAGEYVKAAEAQLRSASFAPGTAKGQISSFCAAVEMCHHALVTGDADDMGTALTNLIAEGEKLEKFRDDPDFTVQQWVLANAPTHRLYAHYLAGESYTGEEADFQQMCDLPDAHRTTYATWTAALRALRADKQNKLGLMEKNASATMDSGTFLVVPNLIGLLVMARVALMNNLPVLAAGIYKTIIAMPCHGGHFVRAVAKRELAAL